MSWIRFITNYERVVTDNERICYCGAIRTMRRYYDKTSRIPWWLFWLNFCPQSCEQAWSTPSSIVAGVDKALSQPTAKNSPQNRSPRNFWFWRDKKGPQTCTKKYFLLISVQKDAHWYSVSDSMSWIKRITKYVPVVTGNRIIRSCSAVHTLQRYYARPPDSLGDFFDLIFVQKVAQWPVASLRMLKYVCGTNTHRHAPVTWWIGSTSAIGINARQNTTLKHQKPLVSWKF
jgi:hypothetical protein